jgi:hypothetical protein
MVPHTNTLHRFLFRLGLDVNAAREQPAGGQLGQALYAAYHRGFVGCFVDGRGAPAWAVEIAHRDAEAFEREMPHPRAEDVFSEIVGGGRGQRAVNWNYYLDAQPDALSGNQDYGNCTAWSGRGLLGCLFAVEKFAKHQPQKWPGRFGTAVAYGFRGGMAGGMSLYTCARVYTETGLQIMRPYCNGRYDLSTEDADETAGHKWGRGGPPVELIEEIAANKLRTASRITEPDAVLDALQAGYFIHVGSTRTAAPYGDPVSALTTPANHAEALIGYDDTEEFRGWYQEKTAKALTEPVCIFDQSWGNWNTVENWPDHLWGRKPQGAFVLTLSDTMRKVAQTGIVYSDVDGFPAQEVNWRVAEYA